MAVVVVLLLLLVVACCWIRICVSIIFIRVFSPPPRLDRSALSAVERSLAGLQSECRRLLVLDRGEDARGSSPSSLSYHIPSMFCWLFMVYVR